MNMLKQSGVHPQVAEADLGEVRALQDMQRAILNILEDFDIERSRLEDAQRATINILDDLNMEKSRVEQASHSLEIEIADRVRTGKELKVRTEEVEAANKELEEQYRRVQEANRLKSEFLANMSHELRTPLNAIIGFTELMHDGKVGPLKADQTEYLGDILTSSRHLLQLINDVLDLSKVESGKMEFRPEPVDLKRTVTEVRDILRSIAGAKRITVGTEIDPDLGQVMADPAKLKQVLYNYLSNALKFTPEGGHVTVRAVAEGPDRFRLEVEDTGIGIKPEDIGRLFVEFQQLDASAAKKYPGTGLGLALTKRLVEAQGGHVGVQSTPGMGSLFYAVLPRVARVVQESEAGPEHPIPQTGARRILVIEDDPKDAALLSHALSSAGYAVETARTGHEAVAKAQEHPFDAITLDLDLPDMPGYRILQAIRDQDLNRRTPVIVVTGRPEKIPVVGEPVPKMLGKPLNERELLDALEQAGVTKEYKGPILVVDDDTKHLKIMEKTLKASGYRAICKSDGERGLKTAMEEKPAAIVLDLLMPGLDGHEYLKRLRRKTKGQSIPVIVLTNKDLDDKEREQLMVYAQAIILKDEGVQAVLNELREWVAPQGTAQKA